MPGPKGRGYFAIAWYKGEVYLLDEGAWRILVGAGRSKCGKTAAEIMREIELVALLKAGSPPMVQEC